MTTNFSSKKINTYGRRNHKIITASEVAFEESRKALLSTPPKAQPPDTSTDSKENLKSESKETALHSDDSSPSSANDPFDFNLESFSPKASTRGSTPVRKKKVATQSKQKNKINTQISSKLTASKSGSSPVLKRGSRKKVQIVAADPPETSSQPSDLHYTNSSPPKRRATSRQNLKSSSEDSSQLQPKPQHLVPTQSDSVEQASDSYLSQTERNKRALSEVNHKGGKDTNSSKSELVGSKRKISKKQNKNLEKLETEIKTIPVNDSQNLIDESMPSVELTNKVEFESFETVNQVDEILLLPNNETKNQVEEVPIELEIHTEEDPSGIQDNINSALEIKPVLMKTRTALDDLDAMLDDLAPPSPNAIQPMDLNLPEFSPLKQSRVARLKANQKPVVENLVKNLAEINPFESNTALDNEFTGSFKSKLLAVKNEKMQVLPNESEKLRVPGLTTGSSTLRQGTSTVGRPVAKTYGRGRSFINDSEQDDLEKQDNELGLNLGLAFSSNKYVNLTMKIWRVF
ncbi:hypothetical protein HK096_011600, partial [Nowakowskiella sp. JEL0078]